jgi:hypothetical protein
MVTLMPVVMQPDREAGGQGAEEAGALPGAEGARDAQGPGARVAQADRMAR